LTFAKTLESSNHSSSCYLWVLGLLVVDRDLVLFESSNQVPTVSLVTAVLPLVSYSRMVLYFYGMMLAHLYDW